MTSIKKDRDHFFKMSDMAEDILQIWLDSVNLKYGKDFIDYASSYKEQDITSSTNSAMYVSSTICDNIGFEDGSSVTQFNANWSLESGIACSGIGCNGFAPVTVASLTPMDNLLASYTITSTGYDPFIGGTTLPVVKPGGTYSFRLENQQYGGDAMRLSRTITVDASKPYYKYSFAAVLEDPGNSHADIDKPYFKVVLKDGSGNIIKCSEYSVVANPSSAEIKENFILSNDFGMDLYYRNWTDVYIPLDNNIGENVTVEFVVSDCAWGGHMGYVYLDGDCVNPTLSVGTCIGTADPVTVITGPSDFIHYSWTGPGIQGSNSEKDVTTNKAGTYTVRVASRGGCYGFLDAVVPACSATISSCTLSASSLSVSSCVSNNNSFTVSGDINISTGYLNSGIIELTVGSVTKQYHSPFSSSFPFSVPNLPSGGGTMPLVLKYYPFRFLGIPTCTYSDNIAVPENCADTTVPCQYCIGTFVPIVGKTYIISAWVKEQGALPTTTTYVNPYIELSYNSGTTTLSPVYASGMIIDGWQRIYYEFTIPSGTTEISIGLRTHGVTSDFDDIRVHPIDAGFTSYVYDPISLKLVAVLDDNNYATFYEYDQEGTLIRTKKETVRGVVTITESRENNPKR